MVGATGVVLAAMMAVVTLAGDEDKPLPPSGELGDPPDNALAVPAERETVARPHAVVVPAVVQVHNEMGKRYRLSEAVVLLDGVEVAHVKASPGADLGRDFPAFAGPVSPGQHAVSVTLIYDGRNPGLIKYFDNYHFRAESTGAFTVSADDRRPASIEVVARERKGLNVAFEQKVQLELAAMPGSNATAAFRDAAQAR